MIQKLFFTLFGLLASLVGVWGVVRLGWTWELAFPAMCSLLLFILAVAAGNRSAYARILHDEDEPLPDEAPVAAGDFVDKLCPGPEPAASFAVGEHRFHVLPGVPAARNAACVTNRYEWGDLTKGGHSASGPSSF